MISTCIVVICFYHFVTIFILKVHNCYGDELGLTSDDEDYIDPNEGQEEKIEILHNIPKSQLSTKSAENIFDVSKINKSFKWYAISCGQIYFLFNKVVLLWSHHVTVKNNISGKTTATTIIW